MSEPIIEVRHLSKSFGTHVVLRDVDFTVNHGDVTCVIGASGSGKSTIARLVASLWDVSGGSITLGGVDIRKLTQEDFFELECALRDAKAAGEKDDAAAVMACDERFHEMIVQAAGNAYVTEFSGTLMLHIRRIKYHYFHLPAMRQASASQHADILAALRAHDAALAKQRMREHWLRAMRGCLNETIAYLEQNEA